MTEHHQDVLDVADGSLALHWWLPPLGRGPGLVLCQEMMGVGPYVAAVAERLAALGYVVAAPDLFWRQQPGWVADHDEAGFHEAFGLVVQVDPVLAVGDSVAALASLAEADEVDGHPGVIGFCFGGAMAWGVAAAADPSSAVAYYGVGIADALASVEAIACPVLLQFGADDPFIAPDDLARIRAATVGRPAIEVHVHAEAGHAFDNHLAPSFHSPAAAQAAWSLTTDFLARHLPVAAP